MKQLTSFMVLSLVVLSASSNDAIAGERREAKEHSRKIGVEARLHRQERRIQNGVKKGQITPEEAQKLESQEAAIKSETQSDRKANGNGHLTKEQRLKINQELNVASKDIKVAAHNGEKVSPAVQK